VLMLSIKCHVVNSQFETMINWLKLIKLWTSLMVN
jgi:hypothetical protein